MFILVSMWILGEVTGLFQNVLAGLKTANMALWNARTELLVRTSSIMVVMSGPFGL